MPFGKYKGVPVCELETHYIYWLLSQREWLKVKHCTLFAAIAKIARQRLENDLMPPPDPRVKGQDRFKAVSAMDFFKNSTFST
jgi:uncharacterized protein (DUF3820 family)